MELGDNVYLPAIDELQIMYLNKDKLDKYELSKQFYWSSTQYSGINAYYISIRHYNGNAYVNNINKSIENYIHPFFYLN